MKLLQFCRPNSQGPEIAIWNEEKKVWLAPEVGLSLFPSDLQTLLLHPFMKFQDYYQFTLQHGQELDLSGVQFLSPISRPGKILCIGLNYRDHAKEFGDPIPSEPVVFNKVLSTLSAHHEPILLPKVSSKIDYEAELVVVIGKEGKEIPKEKALDHVLGYMCGNDVSCRDWQKNKPSGQWFLGKSFDSFAPVGPALVLKDEITDPNHLAIECRVNGSIMQSSNTDQFIFRVEELIAYVSQVMTLHPGDLLFTGTPGGVGDRRTPPVYLKKGDTVEVMIEGLGTLSNPVIA